MKLREWTVASGYLDPIKRSRKMIKREREEKQTRFFLEEEENKDALVSSDGSYDIEAFVTKRQTDRQILSWLLCRP